MGQRFQIIIKTPEEYWNEENPNNEKGKIHLIHFQWLWGYYAIWRLGDFIKGIQILIEEEKQKHTRWGMKNAPIDYKEVIIDSLNWVCHKNLTSQNRYIYERETTEKEEIEEENKEENWNSYIEHNCDNDNGILFLEIDKYNKIKYCFYNPEGNEGTRYNKCLSAEEYLEDYKGDEAEELVKNMDIFNNIKKMKKLPKMLKNMRKEVTT